MKKAEIEQPLMFELGTTFGSYGEKRVTTDMGTSFFGDKLAARLTGAYEDTNSFRHFYGLNRYDASPSFVWKISENTSLRFQAEHLYDGRLPDRGIPFLNGLPAPVDIHTYYGYPQDDFIRNRVNTQSLTFEHRFQHWLIRNNFRHSGYDNIFSNTQPSGITATGLVKREQYNVNSGQGNFFNQTEAVLGGRLAGLTHSALMGIEYGHQSRDTMRFNGTAGSVSLFDPVLTAPIYSTTPSNNNVFTGSLVGIYVNNQVTIRPKWKASVGVRFDHYDQTLDDRRAANADLSRSDNAFSPRAGLVYQPTTWSSIYGSYSRSFQPSGDGLSLAVNNEQLKPETTENFEAGSKFDLFNRKLSTTFSVFRLNRTNVKTIDPNDSSKLVLAGEQRTNGFEWSFSGTVLKGWNVFGGYAYLDSSIIRANDGTQGNQIALVSPKAFNLWSTYSFKNGFGFGGGIIYNDSRYAGNDNIVLLPEYTRVDATLFWKKRKYDVALNLRNIGNVVYYESAQNNFQVLPGSPVNGSVTVRYRW
jgi:catecholate siderophore receptor